MVVRIDLGDKTLTEIIEMLNYQTLNDNVSNYLLFAIGERIFMIGNYINNPTVRGEMFISNMALEYYIVLVNIKNNAGALY